ncbi:hypothetical protein KJ853_01960 [Patescibacteria group bacterium]|nr:hypothetical protein [Patescibacteria group bacterium]
MKKEQAMILATPLLGRNGLIAQTRSYVTRERKKIMKKMKKKSKQPNKIYRTNKDTISLNCDEFVPSWMRPRDSSFDPRLVVGIGFKSKNKSRAQKLKNEVRQKMKIIKRRFKQIHQANCTRSQIVAAKTGMNREAQEFHRFFKGIA